MTNEEKAEAALEAVADFMQSLEPDCMVQQFVLLVEAIDKDGKFVHTFVAPDQKAWSSLGLLEFAKGVEFAEQVRDRLED